MQQIRRMHDAIHRKENFPKGVFRVLLAPLTLEAIDPENVIFSLSEYGNLSDLQFTRVASWMQNGCSGIWG